ncbi:MAG: homoserine kinase [Clostridia bacterium]|nr:homoserine kinase [Clostridia bacterium]
MLHIKVPATSANMGPGFDSIGVALELYNELWVEETESGIEIVSKNNRNIPKGDKNLIYSTIKGFFEEEGIKMPGLKLTQYDNIPMTRGLGSSAACIVAGLLAANAVSGKNYSVDELAQRAARLEGHPDNSNPALMGGMIVGAMYEGGMKCVKLSIPDNMTFAVMIPDFALSTSESRSVLPTEYSRKEVVFNESRTGLLVASVMTGNLDNLRVAMDDAIHQPYRKKLIRGYEEIFAAAAENGSKAEYLSGAGPTLMAIVTDDNAEAFAEKMRTVFDKLPDKWELKLLKPEMNGAVVEKV